MSSALRTSEAGLKLIMAYEGFRSHSTRLPDGRWVIGYGHMRAARAGLKVSQPEAAGSAAPPGRGLALRVAEKKKGPFAFCAPRS